MQILALPKAVASKYRFSMQFIYGFTIACIALHNCSNQRCFSTPRRLAYACLFAFVSLCRARPNKWLLWTCVWMAEHIVKINPIPACVQFGNARDCFIVFCNVHYKKSPDDRWLLAHHDLYKCQMQSYCPSENLKINNNRRDAVLLSLGFKTYEFMLIYPKVSRWNASCPFGVLNSTPVCRWNPILCDLWSLFLLPHFLSLLHILDRTSSTCDIVGAALVTIDSHQTIPLSVHTDGIGWLLCASFMHPSHGQWSQIACGYHLLIPAPPQILRKLQVY